MKKTISRIKSGLFERNTSIAKIAYQIGVSKVISLLTSKDISSKRLEKVLSEFSELKGSLMKAGQLLTVYGEVFIPQALYKTLTQLQESASTVEFAHLLKMIPRKDKEIIEQFSIDHVPLAGASISQIHKAFDQNKKQYALKIRYPGIEKSVKTDMIILKAFIKLIKILPKNIEMDGLLKEVQSMLEQELDFEKEAKIQMKYAKMMPRNYAVIPKVHLKKSTKTLIVSDYRPGITIEKSKSIPKDQRDILGEKLLSILFEELFVLKTIQTDPNPANFKISPDKKSWILYDFGASKNVTENVSQIYKKIIRALLKKDLKQVEKAFNQLGVLEPTDSPDYRACLFEYVEKVSTPLHTRCFDWGASVLEKELTELAKKLIKLFPHKRPPFENVLIDRKISGVYFLLKKLDCSFDVQKVVLRYI